MSTADVVSPAVLDYLGHGAYPDEEATASADLSADVLSRLVAALAQEQDRVKAEIRSQSRAAAPDIDTWIARAKDLHADIQRSRETAREIVAQAEAGDGLRAAELDAGKKVELLDREVTFNETLYGTLEHVRYANRLLERVQDDAVKGDLEKALGRLEDAEASIAGLQGVEGTKVYGVLQGRAGMLRDDLAATTTTGWNHCITAAVESRELTIQTIASAPSNSGFDVSLASLARVATGLAVFDPLLAKLSKDIERAILRPRLTEQNGFVPSIVVTGATLVCSGQHEDTSISTLLGDLRKILEFLIANLPSAIAKPLSGALMPSLIARLAEQWLDEAVPLDMSEMVPFQTMLSDVSDFSDYIDLQGWPGATELRDWVQSAPRTWLTKRREVVLGQVRHLVFTGSSTTKVVERVETQMVSRQEALAATGGSGGAGDDDWDSAWDEPGQTMTKDAPAAPISQQKAADEEDMSAWDDDEDTDATNENPAAGADDNTSAWDAADETVKKTTSGEDEDAWGWDDEETGTRAEQSLATTANGEASRGERQMTLRESFTVTSVPDGILETIQSLISDAETLAGADFASSPIAPAASALYSLPTLALAIYRATAPTAYGKLPTGNMLIYNDSIRLAEQLRAWQAERPPSSRLRLDSDVKALETFAKRAYSSEMEAQRTILRDLVDGAQGFSNSTLAPYKAECESAVEQTVDRLRDVHRQWEGVLAPSALLQSMGSLLATVTGKIILDIEDLGDIGEADSHQLKELIERTTSIKDIFQQKQVQDGTQPTMDMTFIYCPNWMKFLYLAEILDSSLADIRYMWTEGELSLEFDVDEMVDLIEALFAESELRRQAIREVRRGGRV